MKKPIKDLLKKTSWGTALLHQLKIRQTAFKPCYDIPFRLLGRKKSIKKVYQDVFDDLFVLMKCLHFQGDVFEFGVFHGFTSKILAQNLAKFKFDQAELHLFDSFEGLPDAKGLDTSGYEYKSGVWIKGSMNVAQGLDGYIQTKLSNILPNRVHTIKGFFENTLENYLLTPRKAMLVILDCDLYSSTKYVLETLIAHNVIQDGTIIIFDDWMTSLGNPLLGQRKACDEVLQKNPHLSFEKYGNYGLGAHIFIAHDLRIA